MSQAIACIFFLILASCHERGANLTTDETDEQPPLEVAVLPTMDCLPVYYADRMGLFDSLGVAVHLQHFTSQMDIDTALTRGHAQLGHTSLARLEVMERKDGDTLRVVAQTGERLYLITARTKRIRSLKQLKGDMVAVERFSDADYWSDRITEQAGLELQDIYRPQFNDLQLRTRMLDDQLIDAAFLPEPYATQARMAAGRQVFQTPDTVESFDCFASSLPSSSAEERFVKAYARAVRELNREPNADTLRLILEETYALPDDIIDTLALPRLKPLASPSDSLRRRAAQWVEKRMSIYND
ncbi:MAG: ABC transporter substrate-binding protein [Prevotellaceae bacterium]|nr:ABC transporter substrate-binding protein [Prevotellaceae bacterium]